MLNEKLSLDGLSVILEYELKEAQESAVKSQLDNFDFMNEEVRAIIKSEFLSFLAHRTKLLSVDITTNTKTSTEIMTFKVEL